MAIRRTVEETHVSNDNPPRVVKTRKTVEDSDMIQVDPSDLLLAKLYQVIWFVLAVIEILIGFRIFLKFLGANPFSGFAGFVYGLSQPFVAPFSGIFPVSSAGTGSILEWSSILAVIVYGVIAWIVVYLIQVLHPAHPNHVDEEEVVES